MLKRLFILASVLYLFSSLVPVYACSGGRPTILAEVAEPAEIIVEAEVLELDEVRLNGLLRVRRYLAGGPGPTYLLLQQRTPPDFLYLHEYRGGGGGCAVTGAGHIQLGETLYFFLIRNADGTYQNSLIPIQFNSGLLQYRFTADQPLTPIFEQAETGEIVRQEVSEAEFEQLIADLTEDTPTTPTANIRLPLPAPILLETRSGERFIMPVDYQPPYPVTADDGPLWRSHRRYLGQFVEELTACVGDCAIFAGDGIDPLVKQGNLIEWGYQGNRLSGHAVGDAVMLSPTNDLVAVWNGDQLEAHLMNNPRRGINLLIDWQPRPAPYNAIPLQFDTPIYQAAWSHDGRTLAYSDRNGLWLWDVFAVGSFPSLLVPTQTEGVIPVARYWSAGGRYLAIAEGDVYSNYDLVQNKRLPDGLISPDERILLAFDTQATVHSPLEFCTLAPEAGCYEYDMQKSPISMAYWESPTTFIVSACFEDQPCQIVRDSTFHGAFVQTFEGVQFDFEPVSQTLLTIDIDNRLTIMDYQTYQRKIVDLADQFDREIAHIEWLPSPFVRLDE